MEEVKSTNDNNPFKQSPFIDDLQAQYYNFEIKDSRTWFKKFINSMRFGWNSTFPESLFQPDNQNPVIIVGQTLENNEFTRHTSLKKFKEKLRSIPWITYRSHFRPIITQAGKKLTTDSGWGCTIRTGQMMLLVALHKHFSNELSLENIDKLAHLLKLVEENLISAPYSIHNILTIASIGKSPGQWYSPNDICSSLIKLLKITPIPHFLPILCLDYSINKLEIYSKSCEVPKSVLQSNRSSIVLYSNSSSNRLLWKNAIFLMVPLMLGIRNIEEKYIETLKFFLSLPWTTGIIVDRSGSALFLVGFSGDMGIALDPHVVRKANRNLDEFRDRVKECVSEQIVLIELKELGPSVGIGFYVRDEQDFAEFVQSVADNEDVVKGTLVVVDERMVIEEEDEDDEYCMC